ncbi:hypothetical protein BSKO_05144 [Bryopsis sp. KO-2023]|nr:hypothetical protein BSKO_05144 [Bryopsis sp. KO-2023]
MANRPAKSSKELKTAIHDDFKRQVVDDAKKRAVSQHVDYDTFKNMVSVAHLRPIQAPNELKRDDGENWAFDCDGKRQTSKINSIGETSVAGISAPFSRPASQIQFVKIWRQRCRSPSERLAYLKACGVECLRHVFRVELGGDVLGGILEALDFGRKSGEIECEFAFDVMKLLSGLKRFSLNVSCLGKSAKAASTALLVWAENELEWEAARREVESMQALFYHQTPRK